MKPIAYTLSAWLCLMFALPAVAAPAVRIYAAASLTTALTAISSQWQTAGHAQPTTVFASSSTLAKQIEAGAPADIYASADLAWMDDVEKHGVLKPGTREDLLGNALVLIAPKGHAPAGIALKAGGNLPQAFSGKLCTGEPSHVPAGIYAKQALTHLGWWNVLQPRIVGADDVRAALAFVERGECPLGIVYATDAAISDKVEVVATFPESSHPPIVYPFALLKGASPEAAAFLAYLKTPAAAKIFERYGFTLKTR
ncbi:molybdate ABC transporter substrate-binding protein [Solimonas marina]|uniref:Molybdate ABC transporter substrate-binding protein n=1 Tax=Solimonas marina TaxID=2714601 RepID=A0A969W941_9GAMM|nr:molybdate ABC transporter substrate-binding protein [Solimonas marina]NKF21196.1 molybdate ABC transporter substrate-binding protein [Solimonas marina]